jgi:hypothetical protein
VGERTFYPNVTLHPWDHLRNFSVGPQGILVLVEGKKAEKAVLITFKLLDQLLVNTLASRYRHLDGRPHRDSLPPLLRSIKLADAANVTRFDLAITVRRSPARSSASRSGVQVLMMLESEVGSSWLWDEFCTKNTGERQQRHRLVEVEVQTHLSITNHLGCGHFNVAVTAERIGGDRTPQRGGGRGWKRLRASW